MKLGTVKMTMPTIIWLFKWLILKKWQMKNEEREKERKKHQNRCQRRD